MSRGEIVDELGEGEYRVRIKFDTDHADAVIAQMNEDIAQYDSDIASLQTVADAAIDAVTLAANLLTNAITQKNEPDIRKLQKVWLEKLRAAELAKRELGVAKVRRESVRKKLQTWESLLPEPSDVITAWCADYTEGLTGEVGIIDAAAGTRILQPGYGDSAGYRSARDGELTPGVSIASGSGIYQALALYDAWEIYAPTYRTGVLTAIAGDSCAVDLDDVSTRYLSYNANQEIHSLANVGINYMDCNGAAFLVGDRVVVAFIEQDPEQAEVIGFVAEPTPCRAHGVVASFSDPEHAGSDYCVFTHSSDGWAAREKRDMSGAAEMIWLGPETNGQRDKYTVITGARDHPSARAPEIYQYGRVALTAPRAVMGAAIATVGGVDYWIAATLDSDDVWAATADVFWRRPVSGGAWTEIGRMPHSAYGLDEQYHHMYPDPLQTAYLFSESGLKAIKLQRVAKVLKPGSGATTNPEWEYKVPLRSVLAGSTAAVHTKEVWCFTGWHEDASLRREAYVTEVVIDPDLEGVSYSVTQDFPDVTETGTRDEDWTPDYSDPADQTSPLSEIHTVSARALVAVDYIGEARTNLTMDHTITRSHIVSPSSYDGERHAYGDVTYSTSSVTVFEQDGTEVFRDQHYSEDVNSRPYGPWKSQSRIENAGISSIMSINLSIQRIVTQRIDVNIDERWHAVYDGATYQGKAGSQTIDYTERLLVVAPVIGDTTLAVEHRAIDREAPLKATLLDDQPPFLRLLGYMTTTSLGEVAVNPGSGSWPEFIARAGIGFGRWTDLGADSAPANGQIYMTLTGGIFAGGVFSSRSLRMTDGELDLGSPPMPIIGVEYPGDIDDAVVQRRGLLIRGAAFIGDTITPGELSPFPQNFLYAGGRIA